MSDANEVRIEAPEGVEVVDVQETSQEVILSPVETKAADQGWKPKEEWVAEGGDPDEWRSAREFVDRGELLKQIHNQNRKLKQIEQGHDALKQHHSTVYEKAYKDAVASLKAQRRAAMIDGDLDAVDIIEEQIEETKAEYQSEQAKIKQQPVRPDPQFVAWVDRNTWYETNEDLREFADFKGISYAKKHPGIEPAAVLKHVEEEVKKKFPEEFGVRRAAPSPVAGVDKTSRKGAADSFELTEIEESIMKNLVRSKTMTKEEYIKELKKVRG